MKIRNKKTGVEISSSSMKFLSEYHVFTDINLPVFFENGWEEVKEEPHWNYIKRYEDGLAVDACVNEMFSNLPICVKRCADYEIIMPDDEALSDYKYVIRNDSDYTKWCKIKLL